MHTPSQLCWDVLVGSRALLTLSHPCKLFFVYTPQKKIIEVESLKCLTASKIDLIPTFSSKCNTDLSTWNNVDGSLTNVATRQCIVVIDIWGDADDIGRQSIQLSSECKNRGNMFMRVFGE